MGPGTSRLSPDQFEMIEGLATAGAGPAGIVAAIAASPLFTQDERDAIGNKTTGNTGSGSGNGNGGSGGGSGGGKSKKKGGGNGGNGGGLNIGSLLGAVRKGDTSTQNSTSGVPYEQPTTLNPIEQAAASGSPVLLLGLLGAIGIGAYFLLHHHKKKGPPPK
jgi:hypothetical protein